MKNLTLIGLILLIIGAPIYLILIEPASGIIRALIIGLIIGSGYALTRLKKQEN